MGTAQFPVSLDGSAGWRRHGAAGSGGCVVATSRYVMTRRKEARPMDDDSRAAGTSVRRQVLGDAHVDAAVARTDGFTADFQDLITRYAWGEIWRRPGLDRRIRGCITGMGCAGGPARSDRPQVFVDRLGPRAAHRPPGGPVRWPGRSARWPAGPVPSRFG